KASTIKRHCLLGGVVIVAFYMLTTISIVVVLGSTNGATLFALVTVVKTVLGSFLGGVVAVCLMGSFISTALVYNYVFARLLMVGVIDGRLPISVAKLNKNSVPANAIIFQTSMGVVYTLVFFFKQKTAYDVTHVPYKSAGPALADVISGHIQATFETLGTALPPIK